MNIYRNICVVSILVLVSIIFFYEHILVLLQRHVFSKGLYLVDTNNAETEQERNLSKYQSLHHVYSHTDSDFAYLEESGSELKYENIKFWINDNAFSGIECNSDLKMTDRVNSRIKLVNVSNDTGEIISKIIAYNGLNEPKSVGGDVFLLWGEQVGRDGRIPGVIRDNMDGTYTGTVKPFWTGKTIVRAKLGGTIENVCVRISAMKKYGNSVFALKSPREMHASFANGVLKEQTLCGTESLLSGYKYLCNLTQVNGGVPWYCGRPTNKNITCTDLISFHEFKVERDKLIPHQNPGELIKVYGHGKIESTVSVASTFSPHVDQRIPCNKSPKKLSWTYSEPSGYFVDKTWQMFHCKHTISFNEEQYRRCLKNKTIVLLGDSTIRQYADYIMHKVMLMPSMNLKTFTGDGKSFNPKVEFANFGFRVIFKKHEMPHHTASTVKYPVNGITSVATEILGLARGPIPGENIILLFTYCSHMQEFPPTRYSEKMRALASAIKYLLKIKPKANVFIKGPNIYFGDNRWFDLRISLIDKDIIFQQFGDLRNKVTYLDIWSITLAHNSEDIHPSGDAFKSQIQQFMSYVCSL